MGRALPVSWQGGRGVRGTPTSVLTALLTISARYEARYRAAAKSGTGCGRVTSAIEPLLDYVPAPTAGSGGEPGDAVERAVTDATLTGPATR